MKIIWTQTALDSLQVERDFLYKQWGWTYLREFVRMTKENNRLAVVVAQTHPLAKYNSVRLSDLEKYPLALPAKGLQARNTFDRIVEGLDYRFNVRLEINEVNVLLDLVRASGYLTTVLSAAALIRTPGVKALTLDQQGTQMEGSFHLLKDTYMKRATKEFLRMLCENRSYGMAMMEIL